MRRTRILILRSISCGMNGRDEALRARYAAVAGKQKKAGGVKLRTVRALLRKGREERRSMFRAGQFDFLGFLLRVVLVCAIVALFVYFFGQFTGVYTQVKTAGKTDIIGRSSELLTILYTAVVVGLVVGGVGQLGRELFAADDMKIFSALPINARTLFVAKLLSIYRGQLGIALVAVIAVNATFAWQVGVTAAFWAMTVGMCFLLPLITMGIASVLVPLVQVVKRFLRERYVLMFILVTAVLGAGFWLYSLILGGVKELLLDSNALRYFLNEQVGTIGNVCSWLYPARWFADIMTGREFVWSGVGLGLVAVVSIALAMLIIKSILTRALQARNQSATVSMVKTTSLTAQGARLPALLKKEFLMIFRTPSYMFSYFSVAFIMPLMVYFCMDVGDSLVEKLIGVDSSLELAMFLTVLFGAFTNIFCATNISRDGEMFYTVKALPVSYKTVFFSKIILCMIVTGISQAASAILLYATGTVGGVDALFIAAVGLLFGFVNVAIATRYDFNHAKFSTEDDGEIKESSGTVSAVIMMGTLLSFLVGGAVFVLKLLAQMRGFEYGYLTYILGGAAAVIAAALALFYLLFRLKRKYYEFSGGGI